MRISLPRQRAADQPLVDTRPTLQSGTPDDVTGSTNEWCLSRAGAAIEAADAVILADQPGTGLCVLLISRVHPPFAGVWALPGGLRDVDDADLAAAADREMFEEVGIHASDALDRRVLGNPIMSGTWDPRFTGVQVAGVAYLVDAETCVTAGDDAAAASWIPIDAVASGKAVLAFEHAAWLARTFAPGSPVADERRFEQFAVLLAAARVRNAELIDEVNKVRATVGAEPLEYDTDAVDYARVVLERQNTLQRQAAREPYAAGQRTPS